MYIVCDIIVEHFKAVTNSLFRSPYVDSIKHLRVCPASKLLKNFLLNAKSMFDNSRYLTCGVDSSIPLELQVFLWECVERMPAPKDYLQVFDLKEITDAVIEENQMVIHRTEVPEYSRSYAISVEEPITEKVYVIDSGDYCTMLLASEY